MEHIHTPRLENVCLVDRFASKKAVKGTLHLTATHLIFIENSGNKETWILHNHISSVEKQATCPTGCPLLISCKTFQLITLILPRERDGHQLYNSLLKLSQPDNYDQVYAFLYNPRSSETDRAAGWDLLSAQDDYERMGLPNAAWHCTHVNYKYKVCSTYPEDVYTPITVSVPILVASAKFRSKNRLPALSQLLPNGAALCRCSQPLSGFSARCEEDERLLQAIRLANPNCNYLYVVDTRPKINALANRAAGKGYENEDNYTNVRFRFVGIDNIHVMRSSLQRLLEACQAQCITVSAFLSGLEASGWLRHIKTVTDTTVFIAKALWEEGASVLVHCSDGWDRTAQVCSLSAVILHPYYRTTRGFMTVIEKEWIKFGHKFAQRCGHLEGDIKETSPVFLQFLETVWQLAQQFPSAFEFGEELLIQLHHHTTSCQFGNFLGNCDNNRQMLRVRDRTYSVWAHLWDQRDTFANPHYRPNNNAGPIWPNTAACNFTFWRGMYNHFETSLQPRQSYLKALTAMQKRCNELEQEVDQLEDRLTLLQGPRPDKAQIRRLPTSVGLNPPPPDSNPMSTPSLSPGTPQDAYAGVPNNTTNLITLPSSSPSSSDGSSSGVDDDDDDDDFVISNGVLSCSDNSEGLE